MEGWGIIQLIRDPCLSSQGCAVDDQGGDIFPGCIDGRHQPRGSTPNYHQFVEGALSFYGEIQLLRHLLDGWIDDEGAVGEEDRGDGASPLLKLPYLFLTLGILLDVDVLVADPLLPKKLLELLAVGSPHSAEDFNCILCHK